MVHHQSRNRISLGSMVSSDENDESRPIRLQSLDGNNILEDNDDDAWDQIQVNKFESGNGYPRKIPIGRNFDLKTLKKQYPSNAISNAKYNAFTFLPLILFHQFKFFFNLYFLLVAISQFIPPLKIGYISTYIFPLVFVLTITIGKEALDDVARRRRDEEANREPYKVLGFPGFVLAKNLVVGQFVMLEKGKRVPADMVLLKTGENDGEAFIRTDQLDGETDWKLRIGCTGTICKKVEELLHGRIFLYADNPLKDITTFSGTLSLDGQTWPLTIDNTMWANTVLASKSAIGVVVYTGRETRMAMNTSRAGSKVGLLDLEINNLTKFLFLLTLVLSLILVIAGGIDKLWYITITRYIILFSSIIPISYASSNFIAKYRLRVNLDLGKTVYARQIELDQGIPGTLVRTSTIPEELGRVEYLLSDKTGTLTQNEMEMKKLHIGTVSYAGESMDEIRNFMTCESTTGACSRREIGSRVRDAVFALSVCHNVTPTRDDNNEISYQAASPDEIAIVNWTERVGLQLIHRERGAITLQRGSENLVVQVLHVFPFTSESKRMGIVVEYNDEIWFFEKGADVIMSEIVVKNDWLDEESGNMAREGLRTLIIARKHLSRDTYNDFAKKYHAASISFAGREDKMASVVREYLENRMEMLGITGVEDRLQRDVKRSLELLRNAGIRIWMITGDKVETARCVGISSKLVARGQYIHVIEKVGNLDNAIQQLAVVNASRDACLLIDGNSLQLYLNHLEKEFIQATTNLSAVIACRCSPKQKAQIANLIRKHTGKRVACIGDGGNDVSMIQAADVGIGIVGKEGKQASLAADFSITQFCHLTKLLVWHGRNSYKRSAKLAQFVIHRGLIISFCQVVFSVASKFEPIALYEGWLMVGYASLYTMAPVFSFVLDRDVDERLALLYPELYKEMKESKSLSYLSFSLWVLVSVYQGGIIMILSIFLVGLKMRPRLVMVSYTALVLNELIMIATEIDTWHPIMVMMEIATGVTYLISIPLLGDYFGEIMHDTWPNNLDLKYTITTAFIWKTSLILAASFIPPNLAKFLRRKIRPPNYAKLRE
ncbi:putative phospholipid-transporting ATPase NEO1 [Neolecta irregularis DAH-3]|uniref:Phospholipid-transporting ATPase n=1 Tax=Neolecta irregularis (strain DAH-3) TaxID=1198029 RepID=A0A1U7LQI8_NEOID|nr:putative phospholipid-transporting ATPase NEO1 [Neolecta irregularis DAH-3]|eukprot:OLL24936.1 putative phospholipid-transporting ATPase NEO1 [Neolecta irregularis DAH-3]